MTKHATHGIKRPSLWIRICCVALCCVLTVGGYMTAHSTHTVAAEETVDDLNSQKDELAKKQEELQAKRNESAKSLEEQKEQKSLLQEKIDTQSGLIAVNEQLITKLDSQIKDKTDTIKKHEKTIASLGSEIETKQQLLRERMRAISKTSASATALMVLLDSDTYTEYLIGSKVAGRIAEHDQALMDGLEADIRQIETAKKETKEAKATLESERTELDTAKADYEADKQSLQSLYKEADALAEEMANNVEYLDEQIAEIDAQQASLQSTIDAVMERLRAEEEAKRAEEEAKRAEEEAKRAEEEAANGESSDNDSDSTDTEESTTQSGGDTSGTISAMSWPAPTCRVITSSFKYRPQFGRYHKGLDICGYGDSTGQPIVAAAKGTVIYANKYDSWGGGYGLHLMIDHGYNASGQRILTVYAHCNSVTAYEGMEVNAGDTVAYVGNTGNSYGAHLHFEVRVDGSAVDPISNGFLSTSGIDVLG